MKPEFTVPIELRISGVRARVATATVTAEPTVWRPRIAQALRWIADEIDTPTQPQPGATT